MKYYKNTELAKLYNISEKSVRNWIEAAENGKLELELYKHNGKSLIADTIGNASLVAELVEKGRKYRNSRAHKNVRPSKEFYKLFSADQVIDIISCLDIYKEIEPGYTYFGEGAVYWDKYTQKLVGEKEGNTLTNNIDLLDFDLEAIEAFTEDFDHVNVVDVGSGNCLPVRRLLSDLHEKGRLNRYIAIDISKDMLKIAEKNIHKWFDDKIKFEGFTKDIVYERFRDVLIGDTFGKDNRKTVNIVLLFGTVITNFREPEQVLHVIRDSMGKDDLLVTFLKLDSMKSRRFFDFSVESDKAILGTQDRFILDLLNIEESFYDVEQFYDEKKKSRIIQVRLKVSLSINFELDSLQKTIELHKGDTILLWRAWHYTDFEIIGIYDKNNFSLVQATKSKDQEYLLLTSKLKKARTETD
ncbi:MAG TPA: L-histidine N(alpha)-methyltransferase [Candidatus Saccharimonadales bacterium]